MFKKWRDDIYFIEIPYGLSMEEHKELWEGLLNLLEKNKVNYIAQTLSNPWKIRVDNMTLHKLVTLLEKIDCFPYVTILKPCGIKT